MNTTNNWITEGLLPHEWLSNHHDVTAADPRFVGMTRAELLSKVKACRNVMVECGAAPRTMRRFIRDANRLLDLKRRMVA